MSSVFRICKKKQTKVAIDTGLPFIPIRKKGKLPGPTLTASYEKEYGTDVIEIQEGVIQSNDHVLIVDDLLATGGTLKAAVELVAKASKVEPKCLVLTELTELNGRKQVDAPVRSIIQY